MVSRRQFFAKGVLRKVQPSQLLTMTVKVDPQVLAAGPTAARLKVVLEGVRGGEGAATVNGVKLALPDMDWIVEVPIDATQLKAENTLTFQTTGDGYQVDVASLVVETPAK
jgi:hypothetical protein